MLYDRVYVLKNSFYVMEAYAFNNLLRYYTENDISTKVRGRRYD